MSGPTIIISLVFSALLIWQWKRYQHLRRDKFIREAPFPKGLLERLGKHHPQLEQKDLALVSRALRQYFLTYHHSGCKRVSMPSQVVDDLWHEFILYTRHYELFCKQAFGQFFHHTPAVVLGSDKRDNEGLRRVWWHACKEENINPRDAARLPLLFAIDAKLGVADAFVYSLNCKKDAANGTSGSSCCAGDFGDASIDGGLDGFGDGGGDAIGGGGDSGCGGGGCGGGD
ncbi:MAG TPA: hypothetical protein VFF74_05180 [Methylophilaceae bacterium]|nr:hypothetical protein [Methylophilaceae bacterium]